MPRLLRSTRFLAPTLASLAVACGTSTHDDAPSATPAPTTAPSAPTPDAAPPTPPTPPGSVCRPCVTAGDCHAGEVCAQFASDTFCAATCATGTCADAFACTTLSTAEGEQVNACVPRSDVCGPSVGGGPDAGSPAADAGSATCGSLNGPSVPSACSGCGTHACQANGCYGGWFCNTTTRKCQAPPASCAPLPTDAGAPSDAGVPPVTGTVGPTGGKVSSLLFAVVGDTRPATIDDTAGYPTAVIHGIYSAIRDAAPAFVVSTGDYMFAAPSKNEAATQLDLYLAARAQYTGILFPALGNHECTGATASNCGPGGKDGTTSNYQAFLAKMLAPIQKTEPYYSIRVDASDGSWTSKLVFVAGNAWSDAQATWLDATLATPTTYTFVVRHEPAAANTAPGVTPSEAIMAKHPYTLAIVGHTHTYAKTGARQVTVGNGGAPLTGNATYGFARVSQRADLAIVVDMIDASTGTADASLRFALKPDGTPAP